MGQLKRPQACSNMLYLRTLMVLVLSTTALIPVLLLPGDYLALTQTSRTSREMELVK